MSTEFKVIDVGDCDSNVNWETVKSRGIKAAILRVTKRYNKDDTSFEKFYKGAKAVGLKVGVYKYSYALNLTELNAEIKGVLTALEGKTLEYPVYLDLEWSTQRSKLSKATFTEYINIYNDAITAAGYKFGIYCNYDWYKNVLDSKNLKYDFWIARYPLGDNGTVKDSIKLGNDICVGWQYTQCYNLSGKNNTDMSIFYKNYSDKEETILKPMIVSNKPSIDDCINAMISVAKEEIGYCEKKSNSNLDSKTANAGSGNYTKYWRDVKPVYNGQYWCACFVSWVFMKTFGKDMAEKLLKHWPYVYCPTLGDKFTKYANPQKGDIVIFYSSSKKRFSHTGIVTKVDGDKFYTIEGNTDNGTAVVSNGGMVCEKSYYNSKLPGTKFCRPDYDIVTNIVSETNIITNTAITTQSTAKKTEFVKLKKGSKGERVKTVQRRLKKLGFKDSNGKVLIVDGEFGNNTAYAVKKFKTKYNMLKNAIVTEKVWNKLASLAK